MKTDIAGTGCVVHIAFSSVQSSCDKLPIEVKAFVEKIYRYFHMYTVRVTELQCFCDEAHAKHRTPLQHDNTRFLSFFAAIGRLT
jgi:hypothetical protein